MTSTTTSAPPLVPTMLIVDAYSSGRFLAPEFARHGWQCIHVQSMSFVPDMFRVSFQREDFIANIINHGDFDDLIASLAAWKIDGVMVGTETLDGVALADRLAHALQLAGNSPETSSLRRNKYEMLEALRRCDLPVAAQLRTADSAEVDQWLATTSFTWPIVVKPLDSGGTNGVYFCESASEVHQACAQLLGTTHLLGAVNHEVLIQEHLDGVEYVVNTISWGGVHDVTDIWEVRKQRVPGISCIYDRDQLLAADGELQQTLIDYTYKALNALEHRYGPAHSEMIVTKDGPRLLETGARLQGSISPAALSAALDQNSVQRSVAAWVNAAQGLPFVAQGYRKLRDLLWVQLIAAHSGKVVEIPFSQQVQSLPSFFALTLRARIGEEMPRTVDLFSSPGQIFLVHEDRATIENDYLQLRQLEPNGFVVA